MFSSNREIYHFVGTIIEKLDEIQEKQWSSAFRNALSISSVEGEILGETWLTLKSFQKTEFPERFNIKNEVVEAIKVVGKALGNLS